MLRATLKLVTIFILSILLVVASFTAGFGTSATLFPLKAPQIKDGAPAEFKPSMAVFWEAWNIVKTEFYKQPVDENALTYGAIAGMVDALGDQHTAFVDAERAKIFNSDLEGSFEGIGATVEMRDGRLTIVAPIKGTPADKAGLKPGDIVLKVDDTAIENMDVMQAIKLIRGPKGSTVVLTIQRGAQPLFILSVVRDTISVPSVEARMLDDNIAYVKLNEFTATAPRDLHNQLRQSLAQNPKALIFDLRNNPGGFLDVSIKVASEFLKADAVVIIEKFKSGNQEQYKAQSGGVATDIPLVLLINEGSASASEIVAGALKDYKRATIIGAKTFGKGSVQVSHALSDQSQLRVTIAHFFSPFDHEIHGVGISPDIEVKNPTDAQVARGQDPQLDRAIQFVNTGAQLDLASSLAAFFLSLFQSQPVAAHA